MGVDDHIAVLEHLRYKDEQTRLMKDPAIAAMAFDIWINSDYSVLEQSNFMTRAMDEARTRGVDFETIGGPDRAIKALITIWRNHDDNSGAA